MVRKRKGITLALLSEHRLVPAVDRRTDGDTGNAKFYRHSVLTVALQTSPQRATDSICLIAGR